MKKGVLVIALFAVGCSQPKSQLEPVLRSVVSGGTNVVVGAYPAVAHIDLAGATCTGTVVTTRGATQSSVVLTAKHCVERTSPASVTLQTAQGQQRIPVSATYRHNSLDAAVLVLNQPAPVTPIAVRQSPPQRGDGIRVVGYGLSEQGRNDSGIKRTGTSQVFQTTQTEIQVGSFRVAGQKQCPGDSGGPWFTETGGNLEVAGVAAYISWPMGGQQLCSNADGYAVRADVIRSFIAQYEGAGGVAPPGGAGPGVGGQPGVGSGGGAATGCPQTHPYLCPTAVDGMQYCTADATFSDCPGNSSSQPPPQGNGGAAGAGNGCPQTHPYLCPPDGTGVGQCTSDATLSACPGNSSSQPPPQGNGGAAGAGNGCPQTHPYLCPPDGTGVGQCTSDPSLAACPGGTQGQAGGGGQQGCPDFAPYMCPPGTTHAGTCINDVAYCSS